MFDWFNPPEAGANAPVLPPEVRLPLDVLAIQLGGAILAGFIVAAIFRATIISRDRSASLPTTLVLLTVMTAILTLVIGSNAARAFGLVGALSIVRFRTVVEDTRDTAFVIFAVVVGMSVGANYGLLAAVAMVAVTIVAVIMRWVVPNGRIQGSPRLQLCIRIAVGQDMAALHAVIAKYAAVVKATGAATAKQGAAMEVTYTVRLSGEAGTVVPFVTELNRLDGVQSVEVKEKENGKGS